MTEKKPANEHLRALLAEADWTGQQMARAVNSVAAENGVQARYDRTSVAHWLKGSVPRMRVRVLAAEALGRRLGRLVTPIDLGWTAEAPHMSPAEQQDWPHDAVTRLTQLCKADTDPLHGPRLHWSVYQATAVAPQRQGSSPFAQERVVVPARYPADTVALVLGTAIPFFSMALEFGGVHARTALAAYLGGDVSTGLRTAIPRPQSRSLVTDAARLLYLLARMHSDDAHDGLAQRYFRVAFELASTVDDLTTQATVLRAMSKQAGALRHIGPSLTLAEHACELLPAGAPPGVHAYVTSQHALALALAGHDPAARAALRRAETWQQRESASTAASPREPTPADFHTYTPAAWCFQQGETLAALGERAAAITAFRTSLAHRSPHAHRAGALTQAALARMLLQMGHVEEACASYQELLELAPYPQSARVREALLDLKRMLRPFGRSPAVRRLLDYAEHVGR